MSAGVLKRMEFARTKVVPVTKSTAHNRKVMKGNMSFVDRLKNNAFITGDYEESECSITLHGTFEAESKPEEDRGELMVFSVDLGPKGYVWLRGLSK